jgi:hypothetical protein
MDLMVLAKRRALPVVAGKPRRSRSATVLVHVRLAGNARSSARLHGSLSPSDSSAFIRCNLEISDMDASCSHPRGRSVAGLVQKQLSKIGK